MKKVRWGVIGAGGIARRRTLPGMRSCKFAQAVALQDVNLKAAREAAQEFGCPRVFATQEELLACDDVEAVYIATPVYLHEAQFIAACRAGKHVLVEKPLAGDVVAARRMIAAAKKAGVYATEGYMMKFHALHQKAKAMLDRGAIGDVVFARGQLSCWYPPIPGAWRQIPKKGGGGALIDMATHIYDLFEYLVGPIVEVTAFCDRLVHDYPVEDSSTTLLHFAGGAQGVVDCFFNVPDAAGQDRLELYGPLGAIQATGTIGQMPTGQMLAYLSEAGKKYDPKQSKDSLAVRSKKISFKPVNMYGAEVDYLSKCIRQKRPPEINTLEHGLRVLKIALAAYESAKTRRAVKV
ncbi:MAG: Gfo/Idh/MocA family oxidoreductase [Planctomycetota bacterium]